MEFFSGADYDWDGPKGPGKMPIAVFDRAAKWHGTTSEWGIPEEAQDDPENWYPSNEFEDYDNWEEALLMSESMPPVHSGTPHSAMDRVGRHGHYYPVVPLNVAEDEDGHPELYSDDEANLMDAEYRRENFIGGSDDHHRLEDSSRVQEFNPLLHGQSARYLNRYEAKGTSSFVSPPEQTLTLNDRRVDLGLARWVVPYTDASGISRSTGATQENHPSVYQRSGASERRKLYNPQMFRPSWDRREERIVPDLV